MEQQQVKNKIMSESSEPLTTQQKPTQVPIGLKPKHIHEEQTKRERFSEVCGAISRYYNAGLPIDMEWIEEYNELIEEIKKYKKRYE